MNSLVMKSLRLISLVLLAILVASGRVRAQAKYSIAPICVDGNEVAGITINDAGEFALTLGVTVGSDANGLRLSTADGQAILPTLGGQVHSASDLNNAGQVVGSSQAADGYWHAIAYLSGLDLIDFGMADGDHSSAAAINDFGLIVGSVRGADWSRAVVFDELHGAVDLGSLGGKVATATDVNNAGQVVGIALTGAPFAAGATSDPAQVAFLYENGAMVGLGTLGGNTSSAFSINDFGQIVGESLTADGELHAFVYDNLNGLRDLGTPGTQSAAHSISNSGVAVGYVVDGDGLRKAAIFRDDASPRMLQELIPPETGWSRLAIASDINTRGQIAGLGMYYGNATAFVLTPIPEPATATLGVLALLFVAKRGRLRRERLNAGLPV